MGTGRLTPPSAASCTSYLCSGPEAPAGRYWSPAAVRPVTQPGYPVSREHGVAHVCFVRAWGRKVTFPCLRIPLRSTFSGAGPEPLLGASPSSPGPAVPRSSVPLQPLFISTRHQRGPSALRPPTLAPGPSLSCTMPGAGRLTSQRAISHCRRAGAGACPEGRGHAASLGAALARPRRQSKRRAWNLGCAALDLESGALRPDLKLRGGRWANPAAPRFRLSFPLGGLGKEGVGSGVQDPSQLHDSARAAPSSLSPRAPTSPLRVPKSWHQPGLQLGLQPGGGDRSVETHEWLREAAEASSVCARPRRAACRDLRSFSAAVGARRRGGGGGAPTLPRVRPAGGAAGGAGRTVWGRGGGGEGGLGAGRGRGRRAEGLRRSCGQARLFAEPPTRAPAGDCAARRRTCGQERRAAAAPGPPASELPLR